MMGRLVQTGAGALCAVLLAACGGSDNNNTGSSAPPGSVSAPTTPAMTGTGGAASPAATGTGGVTPTMTMTPPPPAVGTGGMNGATAGTGAPPMTTGSGGTSMPAADAGMGTHPMGGGDISSCPAPPASASMQAIAALNAVNTIRLAAGSGCAKEVAQLMTSAQAHCDYYAANASNMMCVADPHSEVASCMNFYGASLGDRIKKAGYVSFGYSEVMAFNDNPQAAVDQWINSVWHRIPLLDPWTTELGYGNATMCDTIDLGTGTPGPDTAVVVYPYADETNVPTEFNGMYEGPMPPAPSTGWPSGPPINVYAKMINVTDHVLTKDGDTTPIDHVWLTGMDQSSTAQFLRNGVMMYSNMPLAAMTKYHVHVKGTSIGGPLNLDWSFTTGAAAVHWGQR
jgi:uncharacterized protein YkwD